MNRIDQSIKAAEGAVDAVMARQRKCGYCGNSLASYPGPSCSRSSVHALDEPRQQGFTPGPWTCRETTANYDAGFHIEGPSHGTLAKGASEANARLIAAAPEMLWALERGLTLINEHADELAGFEHPDVINASVDAMRAAIHKAKGGL